MELVQQRISSEFGRQWKLLVSKVSFLNEVFAGNNLNIFKFRRKPEKIYERAICGNGFVESGEECDCGLPENCDNKCCNPSTCKLKSNSECATGKCCDLSTCRIRKKSEYRPKVISHSFTQLNFRHEMPRRKN